MVALLSLPPCRRVKLLQAERREAEALAAEAARVAAEAAAAAGGCVDTNDHCEAWAGTGECDRNAKYMVGTPARPGKCRQACGACRRGAPGGEVVVEEV